MCLNNYSEMHGPWSKPYTEQKGTEAHNDTHSHTHSAKVGAKEKHDKDICLQPPKNKSPSACRLIFYVHLSPPLPFIFLPLALTKPTPTPLSGLRFVVSTGGSRLHSCAHFCASEKTSEWKRSYFSKFISTPRVVRTRAGAGLISEKTRLESEPNQNRLPLNTPRRGGRGWKTEGKKLK